MTGLLKSVMHEYADQAAPRLDVDAIIAEGDRRVRRTRVIGVVAGVAAVAVIATVTPLAANQWLDTESPVAPAGPPPFQDREVTFAEGSDIHYGDRVIHAGPGLEVASYVQTDHGFVFATKNGDVYFNGGDDVDQVGTTSRDGLYLKADDDGSAAAWVEFPDGAAPVFVVYDTERQVRVLETSQGNTPGMGSYRDADAAYIYALDEGSIYWRSGEGAVRYHFSNGTSEVLDPKANPFAIEDVANGRIAHVVEETRRGGDGGLAVSGDLADDARPLPSGWSGTLSPRATYVAVDEADEMAVYDVATRQDVSPTAPSYAFVAAYGWLDDRTVLMVGLETTDDSQPIDLLRCDVPAGACTVAVDGAGTFGSFALPVGQPLD